MGEGPGVQAGCRIILMMLRSSEGKVSFRFLLWLGGLRAGLNSLRALWWMGLRRTIGSNSHNQRQFLSS
jgi:hypothetical protein